MPHIAVLGAGITGVTTAYSLHVRGFDVTVYDRQRYAGMETSFANGGQLSASNAEVWNQWSTVLKGIKWMLQGDAPLFVNPRPGWHKVSWMTEFLANIPRYKTNTTKTAAMAVAARAGLAEMAENPVLISISARRGSCISTRPKKTSSMPAWSTVCSPRAGWNGTS